MAAGGHAEGECWRATAAMRWCAATGTSRTPSTPSRAWKANVMKSGFLPSVRQWLTDLLDAGWVVVVRERHPDVPRPVLVVVVARQGVRQRRGLADRLAACHADLAEGQRSPGERAAANALRRSDHAPVTVEYLAAARP